MNATTSADGNLGFAARVGAGRRYPHAVVMVLILMSMASSPTLAVEPSAESEPVAPAGRVVSSQSSDISATVPIAYLNNPKPPYPQMSRRLREEGRVELRVFVLANGSAGKIEIQRSSGYPNLDESAITTVEKWRFKPARQGDKAVDAWIDVPIEFRLIKES